MKKRVPFRHCAIWIIFSIVNLCCHVAISSGHTPHDVIDAIELSPIFEEDNTLFIIISDHLRKSTNGGFSWKELVNGLDHTSLLSSIAISGSFGSDQTLFVSSDGNGIYRSNDGGNSWVKKNTGLKDLNIGLLRMYSISDKKILLAASSRKGLYKSKDGGDSWYQVIDKSRISAISFWPATGGKKILVGDSAGKLYISQDAGETWDLFDQNSEWGAINVIAFPPSADTPKSIFIGTEKKGLIKTTDAGLTFIYSNKGLPDSANIRSLATSPTYEADTTLFVSTWYEAIFRSSDGGESWQKYDRNITTDSQADSNKYRSPHFRAIKISNSHNKDKTIFLGGFDGLFKSSDAGQNWLQLETLPVSQIKGLAISKGSDNYSIAITTYGGGAYISKDKGNSWLICNKGLKTTRLSDIVFSYDYPSDKTLYSASIGILLKSTDDGYSWRRIVLNPKSWRHKAYAIARKLKVPRSWRNKILKSSERKKKWPTTICLSPRFSQDHKLFFATRYHGIFKSDDGGINISRIWDGMEKPITALVISPNLEKDGTLFASVRGMGIYKTRNKGKNWQPVNNGLWFVDGWENMKTVHQIAVKDIKMAISPYYSEDQTVFAGASEGLFKTLDGGNQWEKIGIPPFGKNEYVAGLAVSPNFSKDRTVLVSLRGRGLFKSTDSGHTFMPIANDLRQNNHSIEYICFSPQYRQDHTIYAASDEELFKSTDSGTSWKCIQRPVRYENHREIFHYTGQWTIVKGSQHSASTISVCNEPSAKASIYFTGTRITIIGPRDKNLGIAKIFIDDKFIAALDQYGSKPISMSELYSIHDLPLTQHKLTVEVSGSKNSSSTGNLVGIDAVDVLHQCM